jgi:heat shock protein HslJ
MMRFLSFLSALFVLAACQTQNVAEGPPVALAGTSWIAEQVVGERITTGMTAPTLQFGEGREMRGETNCNRFTGRYEPYGVAGINVYSLVSVAATCADSRGIARHQQFIDALDDARIVRLEADGRLVLSTDDHRALIFHRAG